MSFLLRISNPNTNELVVSDQATGLCCIGRAVLQTIVQPSGDANTGAGRTSGYSVYRVYHPNPVIFALDMGYGANGTVCCVLGVSQPAAGVWDVTIFAGNAGNVDGNNFYAQYEIAVWGFSWYNEVLDPRIGTIRDANNNLKWDFSRRNLLFPRAFGVAHPNGNPSTFTPVGRQVILGTTNSYRNTVTYGSQGKGRYTRNYFNAWRGGLGQVYQVEVSKFWSFTGGIDEGGDNNDAEMYDTSFIILEGQDFP